MISPTEALAYIKQYNLKVEPCLVNKEKFGELDYWFARQMVIFSGGMTNGVPMDKAAYGRTPEEAIERVIKILKGVKYNE